MKDRLNTYTATLVTCCIGMLAMAAAANLTPLLFIPLQEQFGFSFGQLGTLVLINFITQVSCDVLFSKAVDRHGYRRFVVSAQVLCVVGFVLFAATPWLFRGAEYFGFVISTILFSGSSGLSELLLSPIIDAIPQASEDPAGLHISRQKLMPLTHSFYAWGSVFVIVVTTLLLLAFGRGSWPYIVLGWAVVPAVLFFLFLRVPLRSKAAEMRVLRIRELLRKPVFWISFAAICLGGAAEVTMNQWTSAFMESVLDIPKATGDLLGMCAFAVFLGLGRLFYGVFGDRFPLRKILIFGSFAAAVCYLAVAFCPVPWIALAASGLSGFCVSLLWPGTLVIASDKLPLAGASLFALLAAGGDLGAALGPAATGYVAEGSGLPLAFALAAIVPLLCGVCHIVLARHSAKTE